MLTSVNCFLNATVFKCHADIDECAAGLDNCDSNATCTNTDGSFICTCKIGFDGDGTTCIFNKGMGVKFRAPSIIWFCH